MSEPFIGEIMTFSGTYAPKNWMFCTGQLLPIRQYTALFSILGTYFGGDGRTTFALPNLVDCFVVGAGQGPITSNRIVGETGGSAAVTVTAATMAPHHHAPSAQAAGGTLASPENAVWATSSARDKQFAPGPPDVQMAPNLIDPGPVGGGQPHPNLSPGFAINYIIALDGIFPRRP